MALHYELRDIKMLVASKKRGIIERQHLYKINVQKLQNPKGLLTGDDCATTEGVKRVLKTLQPCNCSVWLSGNVV